MKRVILDDPLPDNDPRSAYALEKRLRDDLRDNHAELAKIKAKMSHCLLPDEKGKLEKEMAHVLGMIKLNRWALGDYGGIFGEYCIHSRIELEEGGQMNDSPYYDGPSLKGRVINEAKSLSVPERGGTVELVINDHNCIYCGQPCAEGELFAIFPQRLLYEEAQESEQATANLAHAACMSRDGMWTKGGPVPDGAMALPPDTAERLRDIKSVVIEEYDPEPVPCGTKRGPVSMFDGLGVEEGKK